MRERAPHRPGAVTLPTVHTMHERLTARTAHSEPPMLTPASVMFGEKPAPQMRSLVPSPPLDGAIDVTLGVALAARSWYTR